MLPWIRTLYGAATIAIAALAFYYAIIHRGSFPNHKWIYGYNDLLLHFGIFALLSIFAASATKQSLWAPLSCSLFATWLEAMQLMVPGRTASLIDLVASLSGILITWFAMIGSRNLAVHYLMRNDRSAGAVKK